MKKTINIDVLADLYPDAELLKIDGYDDCYIGIATRFGSEPVLAYDRDLMIKKLMLKMPRGEAEEFFDFNIAGAWVGEGTPIFIE